MLHYHAIVERIKVLFEEGQGSSYHSTCLTIRSWTKVSDIQGRTVHADGSVISSHGTKPRRI